jgi:glycine dehydrogenase subunit 1
MRYLPHTDQEIQDMLQVVGAGGLEELFPTIPADCRRKKELDLADPLTEWELEAHMNGLTDRMPSPGSTTSFLGAGSYEHHIPSSTQYLVSRSEFCTAYTPYQPEISQGTLQAIFEYQTLVSRLLGLDVSNASMYDGASALAEALFMALRVKRKKGTVALSKAIHPLYRRVVATYFEPTDFTLVELPYLEDGRTDLSQVQGLDDLAAVALQSPNFFGCIEDLASGSAAAHESEALFVTAFTEPLTYGLYPNPGSQGADIACGEGQSLGIPQSFGGPGLGVFCATQKLVRNMPGRLVGQTTDRHGQRGFVLTLATREQHIRREKATSNICSNQGLCATMAAMYLASLGGTGIRQLAALNRDKAEYLKNGLQDRGCTIPFSSPTFNEFVVRFPAGGAEVASRLKDKGIFPGLELSPFYPELADHFLVCVTETKTRDDLDRLIKEAAS